ncbi:MAG: 50S ribosomal protein L25 [Chloroflexota bacterium]
MEEIVLKAEPRTVIGKQVKALRREGKLPAVIYGHGFAPMVIVLDYRTATRSLMSVSSSHLIAVEVEGQPHNVLVRERQFHPVSGAMLHVDFQEVSMTERLRTSVSLVLEGDAPAVKNYNGVIVTGQEEVEVECLPRDLPERIEVDLSVLKEIGDAIYVRDLVIAPEVEVLTDGDEMIILVTAPAAEPKVEGEEAIAAEEEPEVIERGKREEGDF